MKKISITFCLLALCMGLEAQIPQIDSQWKGARVAILGDSISASTELHETYWEILEKVLGITTYVYAKSGKEIKDIINQTDSLSFEHGQDVDAILILIGTNDFNHSVPIGEWFYYRTDTIAVRGNIRAERLCKEYIFDYGTFKGNTNRALRYIKQKYPKKQIIIITPLHRGYAHLRKDNIQPEECYANACGSFFHEYVDALKEAGSIWSMPVIDLYMLSGLLPTMEEQHDYMRGNMEGLVDYLHPNAKGHKRMAYTIAYQLLSLPSSFE